MIKVCYMKIHIDKTKSLILIIREYNVIYQDKLLLLKIKEKYFNLIKYFYIKSIVTQLIDTTRCRVAIKLLCKIISTVNT